MTDLADLKPGLTYECYGSTDPGTLHRRFTDELAVYRARRRWPSILSSHFLLEPDRDYLMTSHCDVATSIFVLSVSFTSACGRFAFGRLANRQAPEAEAKLLGEVPEVPKKERLWFGS